RCAPTTPHTHTTAALNATPEACSSMSSTTRGQSVVTRVMAGGPRRAVWHRLGSDSPLSLLRDEMPTKEPSRCGQVTPGGLPVVCEYEQTAPGIASGRVFSPIQGVRLYSSRLAMRAVRPALAQPGT